jgi:hypothetical protein
MQVKKHERQTNADLGQNHFLFPCKFVDWNSK